ncbi:MAG: bifunctional phosphoribosylaminoimidazolecarboxamide formyltransferase/IMP cyclohydrolase [Lewinellaceae bacterium]|nr:bifunctional phosphoribosylaminoimidazolecarboxamide formyltransferase/IMP cyclohydrolase [Lewinellaceae bacterium]
MSENRKIKTALISVYNKTGVDDLADALVSNGVNIISTGGTAKYLTDRNIEIELVEDLTGFPEMLGGRVKTLHPKVFGGILARRNETHLTQLDALDIPTIDLVVVDLYPFEDTVASGASHEYIIEKIDIGGISLVRAAAKNFQDVVILSSKDQYTTFIKEITEHHGSTSLRTRQQLAKSAFSLTSEYDRQISEYFMSFDEAGHKPNYQLRYGENPHQKAEFIGNLEDVFTQISGKEISYNNLVDIDAALQIMSEFKQDVYTVAILKHTNICGIATRDSGIEAWEAALACDPTSAFGGIIIANFNITMDVASSINKLFYEVLLAPSFDDDTLELLKSKQGRILLKYNSDYRPQEQNYKTLLNGEIQQTYDYASTKKEDLKIVTSLSPDDNEIEALIFANKCVKHLKSNTIVFVKDRQMIGMGCGQTSRIDACRYGIEKAKAYGFDLKGSVMASDAFFPFPDCVEMAYNEGITAVIQPGGSIKDQLSIDFCDKHGVKMVFTGVRHFKH